MTYNTSDKKNTSVKKMHLSEKQSNNFNQQKKIKKLNHLKKRLN